MMNIAKLKAAAEKATPGPWRRTATIFNGITYGPFSLTNEKVLANVAEKANAEFIAAANPAAVLELIAALEAAEQQRDSWRTLAKQNIAEREKDIAALDEARQRIADLESKLAQSESWAVSAQSHIASLESRTVRLPVADIGTAKEFYEDAVVVPLSVVNEACAAAGINLETGGEA